MPQRHLLLGEAIDTARVPRRHDLLQERDVLLAIGERAAAAEQERLVDRGLEVADEMTTVDRQAGASRCCWPP
ncbi:MAG: hypothetical protein U0791_07295 [Gemmataceae bacterium]